MTRKFWNCDGGSPEADLTVADAETGDRSATAETSPAICRPDLSGADAKRLADPKWIDQRYAEIKREWPSGSDDEVLHAIAGELQSALAAANAKIAQLEGARAQDQQRLFHYEGAITALTAERDAERAVYQEQIAILTDGAEHSALANRNHVVSALRGTATMTSLERAREVVAGWHDRLIGDIALIIAEAEARGRAAGLEEAAKAAAEIQVERPGVVWMQACGAVKERIRALADPSPDVREP